MSVDLSAISEAPWPYNLTVGTTWTEVLLPDWAHLRCYADATFYIGHPKGGEQATPESPVDGEAVGSHYNPVGPVGWVEVDWPIGQGPIQEPKAQRKGGKRRVYFAVPTGTATISLEIVGPSQVGV